MATQVSGDVRSAFALLEGKTRRDPYPAYERLRAAGPVVRLTKYDIWAVPRYAEIKAIFADHNNFSNAGGSGVVNNSNHAPWPRPTIIPEVDPPMHTRTRKVLARV